MRVGRRALLGAAVLWPAAAALAGPPPPPPRLSGTLIDGDRRVAIFIAPDGDWVVGEGDAIGRYTVREIRPGAVALDGPEGAFWLRPAHPPEPALPVDRGGTWPIAQGEPVSDK